MSAAPALPEQHPPEPPSPERDALERILRSDALERAPNLISFLRYVCEMQLSGRTDAIKEYNIAVEALARGAEFDQKKDSIVRVEAHRLRKRLTEYYRTAGARDPVEIALPPGSYVPVFRVRETTAPPEQGATEAEVAGTPAPVTLPRPNASRQWLSGSALLVFAIIAGAVFSYPRREPAPAELPQQADAVIGRANGASSPSGVIRIACGSQKDRFADTAGTLWGSDRYFEGGELKTANTRPIRRAVDSSLYLTRREGEFEYRIPVPPEKYEVRLHFAETVFGEDNVAGGGESSRVFHVQINEGAPWLADIVSDAGGANVADVRVYRGVEPGPDGTIRIAFLATRKEAPFVNAIEVMPAPDGLLQPVRIVARTTGVRGMNGAEWLTDRFWIGGQSVLRHEPVAGPEPSAMYQGERYGNFSYAIPVAEGTRYTLTPRFAETWFGEGRPGGGGDGSRVFDVYCNGRALLRNFDVHREAGGHLRQLRKVFRGLGPNAQGKLNLEFVPVQNYAMVNALEVVDEGR